MSKFPSLYRNLQYLISKQFISSLFSLLSLKTLVISEFPEDKIMEKRIWGNLGRDWKENDNSEIGNKNQCPYHIQVLGQKLKILKFSETWSLLINQNSLSQAKFTLFHFLAMENLLWNFLTSLSREEMRNEEKWLLQIHFFFYLMAFSVKKNWLSQ